MKEIEYLEKLEPVDGKFVFTRVFKAEMSKEDCLKFKSGAEKNIKRINEELGKQTEEHIQFALKELYDSVDNEAALKKEALKDFDKYKKEAIETFEQKTNEKKKEFQEFLQHIDEIKKEIERRTRALAKQEKENLLFQLKDEEKIAEVYKDIKED